MNDDRNDQLDLFKSQEKVRETLADGRNLNIPSINDRLEKLIMTANVLIYHYTVLLETSGTDSLKKGEELLALWESRLSTFREGRFK